MASASKNLSQYEDSNVPSAAEMTIGIVVAEWNHHITHKLYKGCLETLVKHGADEEHIHTLQVPGSFELPVGGKLLAGRYKLDAVICIGCVIQGETRHNEYINNAVSSGLTNLSIATGIPFIFGILTPDSEEQALDRAGGKHGNKGVEAAVTAIRMADIKRTLGRDKQRIGFSQ